MNEDFENLNSLNTIIGRNVYVVPRPADFGIPSGNTSDYYNLDGIIFATGLNQNNPDNSSQNRDIGAFGSIMNYRNIGNTGDNDSGSDRGGNYFRDVDVMGVMNLRGAAISYNAGYFGLYRQAGSSYRGMFMHYYFDQRIPQIGSPYIITGAVQLGRTIIFELVRLDQI